MMRKLGGMALAGAALVLTGCVEEELQKKRQCKTVANTTSGTKALDVAESAQFQQAYNIMGAPGADAVQVQVQRPSTLAADALWRVGTVEVLVALPDDKFNDDYSGVSLGVTVFDGGDPNAASTPRWSVSQAFDKNALTWESAGTRPQVTDKCSERSDCKGAGAQCDIFDQQNQAGLCIREGGVKTAWWSFDLGAQIGETNMSSGQLMVAVRWPDANSTRLLVGSSEFKMPCDKNWTDFGEKGFEAQKGDKCAWPMLKVTPIVTSYTKEQATDCE